MAKYCVNCKFHKRMAVNHGNQAMMIPVCMHQDFGDPVTGEPLPAHQVRSIKELCGINGTGFVKAIDVIENGDPPKLVLGG